MTTECHLAKHLDPIPPEYETKMLTMPFGVKISYCRTIHEIAVKDRFWLTWTVQIVVYLTLTPPSSRGQTPKSHRKQPRTASVPERIRIGYPRNTNRFIDLLGHITDSETTICSVYQSHHWLLNSHREHRWNTDIEASDRHPRKKKETFLYSYTRYTQLENRLQCLRMYTPNFN